MKKTLYHFKPSQNDLFSIVNSVLGIFVLTYLNMPFNFLFVVLVALYTIAMDRVYDACK